MTKDKVSTNQCFFSLVKQRISAQNEEELDLLVNSTVLIRRQMFLLAICKAHALIFDFISVNVRDCFFAMQERVTHANFNEFFNEKKYAAALREVREFATILAQMSTQRLTIDLDDGVRVNYPKYYPLVDSIKGLDKTEK